MACSRDVYCKCGVLAIYYDNLSLGERQYVCSQSERVVTITRDNCVKMEKNRRKYCDFEFCERLYSVDTSERKDDRVKSYICKNEFEKYCCLDVSEIDLNYLQYYYMIYMEKNIKVDVLYRDTYKKVDLFLRNKFRNLIIYFRKYPSVSIISELNYIIYKYVVDGERRYDIEGHVVYKNVIGLRERIYVVEKKDIEKYCLEWNVSYDVLYEIIEYARRKSYVFPKEIKSREDLFYFCDLIVLVYNYVCRNGWKYNAPTIKKKKFMNIARKIKGREGRMLLKLKNHIDIYNLFKNPIKREMILDIVGSFLNTSKEDLPTFFEYQGRLEEKVLFNRTVPSVVSKHIYMYLYQVFTDVMENVNITMFPDTWEIIKSVVKHKKIRMKNLLEMQDMTDEDLLRPPTPPNMKDSVVRKFEFSEGEEDSIAEQEEELEEEVNSNGDQDSEVGSYDVEEEENSENELGEDIFKSEESEEEDDEKEKDGWCDD